MIGSWHLDNIPLSSKTGKYPSAQVQTLFFSVIVSIMSSNGILTELGSLRDSAKQKALGISKHWLQSILGATFCSNSKSCSTF